MIRWLFVALLPGLLLSCTQSPVRPDLSLEHQPLLASHALVAADSGVASRAGVAILQQGGNAVDAAVTVGLVLGVVNPFASGLGGGGFALVHEAGSGTTQALDFREMAPQAAHRDLYLLPDGSVSNESRMGGLAAGVPTELLGWWELHQRYGALPWASVVEPARLLADQGFEVHALLIRRLEAVPNLLERFPRLAEEFSVHGELVQQGQTLRRPGLAATLARIAEHGVEDFYRGETASLLVEATREAGGILSLDDLAQASVRWLEPVMSTYRGHTIYGMPPPSSGGLVIAQVLGVLEPIALSEHSWEAAETVHRIADSLNHAFADRAHFVGDPDFFEVPLARFLSPERHQEIRQAFDPNSHREPEHYGALALSPNDDGTAHFSIVDAQGNAVACTVTVNTVFGSGVIAGETGILLNNEMDDFAAAPGVANSFGLVGGEANAIAAGKRPLSSMSPTIVLYGDELVGTLGGSGGPMIITETLLGLLQLIDYGRDAMTVVSAPRFHVQWLPDLLFHEPELPAALQGSLEPLGYTLRSSGFQSALQVIWRHPAGWQAASDPRKLGEPAGY